MPLLRLEAEVLLSAVLKQDKAYLYTWPDKRLAPEAEAHFLSYIRRRAAGEPIAYILQQKEFWSLSLEVSSAVLIPDLKQKPSSKRYCNNSQRIIQRSIS